MKIALFGYGKMGHVVEQTAARQGIEVVAVVDPLGGSRGEFVDAEVCLDFTEPAAALGNVGRAAAAGISIVVGTTGWYDQIDQASQIVDRAGTGLVYGSNFSLGVNLMFRLVAHAADLFAPFLSSYDPFIEEAHHKFKKDAPSGTALMLKQILESKCGCSVPAASLRAGYFPGLHTVGFDSEADTLEIKHTAKGRVGFAEGALLAAKWIRGRKGLYQFSQVIDETIAGTRP
jgi:4-hydroxy-tetrahydrodipicolinate reductase